MSDRPTEPTTYADEASVQDELLDRRLAGIRGQEDRGEISTVQAADLRVAALEDHLAAIRTLRAQHFGEPDPALDPDETEWLAEVTGLVEGVRQLTPPQRDLIERTAAHITGLAGQAELDGRTAIAARFRDLAAELEELMNG